ncbi:hypothetical protein ElyMa_001492400 [Elysia marginata]|uniref:CTCK domain-containing protein n=1 Tax=Elysia marginata TaxID=1093978 RepID=A0AAV4J7E1_9GAST|nr:hypothetical protein ElyMa_001492400 [Elysia marginata]
MVTEQHNIYTCDECAWIEWIDPVVFVQHHSKSGGVSCACSSVTPDHSGSSYVVTISLQCVCSTRSQVQQANHSGHLSRPHDQTDKAPGTSHGVTSGQVRTPNQL